MDYPGPPSPILHNFIPLNPPPHTFLLRLCTRLSLIGRYYKSTALFNQYISHKLYTWCILEIWVPLLTQRGKWGPLDDANDKQDHLVTWWEIIGHTGAPWMINWDPSITWWEIRGHHFDDMMRKLGALDGAMDNLGPFALKKQWRAKREIMSLKVQWNINLGPFDDKMGKLETLAMMKLGPLMISWGIGGPRPQSLFKRLNTPP